MPIYKNKVQVLLTPSISSFITCLILSIAIMVFSGFSYQAGEGAIFNYLFGPNSTADQIASSKSTLNALNTTILGNTTLNKILYFAFWMVIGLIVYIILYVFLRGTGEAAENIKEASYSNIKKDKILEDFAIKSVVRFAAVMGLVVFSIIISNVLLPFSVLTARTVSSNVASVNGLVYGLTGTLVLFLSFHVVVILVRLIFLKVRLFSQQEV